MDGTDEEEARSMKRKEIKQASKQERDERFA
jgi:hypothetical protein